jgi:hypothetical protein
MPTEINPVLGATLFVVILGAVAWLCERGTAPGEPSLWTLLARAEVKCPHCGRAPTNFSRSSFQTTRATVTCSLLHTWTVSDDEWLPDARGAGGRDGEGA